MAFEPEESLIHRFGVFGCHGAHSESLRCDVVHGYQCAGLFVAKFFEGPVHGGSQFAPVVKCDGFSLGCRQHDVFNNW